MRDPKKIDVVIELLRSYWHANPDLRLGQIVYNVACGSSHHGPFYVADEVLEEILREELRTIAKEHK